MPPRARTTPTKKTSKPEDARQQQIQAFEHLRQRASKSPFSASKVMAGQAEPYVLGPDKGFDPPISVSQPTGLRNLEALDNAWRARDMFGILRVMMGSIQYERVVAQFDQYPDAWDLLVGLVMDITDHFQGAGASEVPGGTQAS
jgi:hypothetical protein